ncbi:DUF2924 domain-containing protein [Lysobacter sp. K5869]|uniref:DUF2924 domain-containing protein n=1 Tax=Lysobacter sp. K5869 TaxID=2820808 RepID=UPI001C06497A|nr:DUF2924 domain-containing protein [Lysobacter sp. K5869]QWP77525.1 DUF2924 domain-containing protein [Lysobacter sp. K5869]
MKKDMPAMPAATVARVVALRNMTMRELKAQWSELFENAPPVDQRRFLERRIAYRLQELAWSKHHAAELDANRARIDLLVDKGKLPPRVRNGKPMPGSVLIRHFGGQDHVVTVRADGDFDYRGQSFSSLSALAKHITGTPWSGPVFFGLRSASAKTNGGPR